MILVLQVLLTIQAFKNGRGPLAFLPMAFALSAGLALGLTFGEDLMTEVPLPLLLAPDLLAVVALIAMAQKRRPAPSRDGQLATETQPAA